MSLDRLAVLEHRLAVLERRQRASVVLAVAGLSVLVLGLTSLIPATQAQGTSEVRAPFRVVNAVGQEIFSVTQAGSETRLNIVDHGKVAATLSASENVASLILGGPNTKGLAHLAVNFTGDDTGPSLLLAQGTRNVLSVEDDLAEISAPLTVLPKNDVPALRVDADRVTATNELAVRASKGTNRTTLGPTRLSIHGVDGTSVAASLGLDESQRGILRVGTPTGLRAALGFTKSGQALSLGFFDTPAPDPRLFLYASAEGASVHLKTPKAAIDLNTDAMGGLVNIGNDKGSAAVSLEVEPDGSGRVTIGNAAGETVVEAEATDTGLGVVKTGPGMRRGTTRGLEGVPSAILGKR